MCQRAHERCAGPWHGLHAVVVEEQIAHACMRAGLLLLSEPHCCASFRELVDLEHQSVSQHGQGGGQGGEPVGCRCAKRWKGHMAMLCSGKLALWCVATYLLQHLRVATSRYERGTRCAVRQVVGAVSFFGSFVGPRMVTCTNPLAWPLMLLCSGEHNTWVWHARVGCQASWCQLKVIYSFALSGNDRAEALKGC